MKGARLRYFAVMMIFIFALAPLFVFAQASDTEKKLVEKFEKKVKPPQPLLAPDLAIEDVYKPGTGPEIGRVEVVQGDAFVHHMNTKVAYRLAKGNPLFAKDQLVTGDNGRIRAKLNDMSTFALSENTRMRLTKVLYQPTEKKRDTDLELSFGKARLIAAKLAEGSVFEVKTPAAVAGIRGSDFAIMVYPESPEFSAISRFLAFLNPIGTAHAQPAAIPLSTTIVTGQVTTVTLGDTVIPSLSTVTAFPTGLVGVVTGIGAATAIGVLGGIGPAGFVASMPDHMIKRR